MNAQAIDTEALANLLANVGIDPARFELAVREALDGPEPGHGFDRLTGADIRVLAKALDINIGYFDKFYREQDAVLRGVGFVTRSFRNEAIGYQRVFARSVSLTNFLLGAVIVLLLAVLGFLLFLTWPALVFGDRDSPAHEHGEVSLCCSRAHTHASIGPPEG